MRLIDSDWILDYQRVSTYETVADGLNAVRKAPAITKPPNDPLTISELLEMDGEPVWVVNSSDKRKDGFCDEWALVSVRRKDAESVGTIYHFENYGNFWFSYRRKPTA